MPEQITNFTEWLKTLPWWASTLFGFIVAAVQILYPLYVTGQPITLETIMAAIATVIFGALIPAGARTLPSPPPK